MQTITICGSMRYAEEMKNIAFYLETQHDFNVLQCVYNPLGVNITDTEKQKLARAHLKKIDLSDAIYVVDIDGYVGESVRKEIEYAESKGKKVIRHSTANLH